MSNVVYIQIVKIINWCIDTCIRSVWIVIKILLITGSKYREVCFKLAMFCNISLLYDNVITFIPMTYLTSRVTVWHAAIPLLCTTISLLHMSIPVFYMTIPLLQMTVTSIHVTLYTTCISKYIFKTCYVTPVCIKPPHL